MQLNVANSYINCVFFLFVAVVGRDMMLTDGGEKIRTYDMRAHHKGIKKYSNLEPWK